MLWENKQIQIEKHATKHLALEYCQYHKVKEKLRNCHQLEETKEIRQSNNRWDLGLHPGATTMTKNTSDKKKMWNQIQVVD